MYDDLDQFFTELNNFHGGYDAYRDRFVRASAEARAAELIGFDKLIENEHKPTREHAEWVTKRRQLGDLHNLLLRGGR
jgi:hypothetical protein